MSIAIIVLSTIGITASAVIIILYMILRHYQSSTIPRQVIGYGKNGQFPKVIRDFKIIDDSEFV